MTHQGRRKQQRYHCDMLVWLRLQGAEDDFLPAEVVNVSSGGILCTVHQPYPLNQMLELRISLLQYEDMVPVKAMIRHLRPMDDDTFAMGLQFIEVEGATVRGFMASLEAMFS